LSSSTTVAPRASSPSSTCSSSSPTGRAIPELTTVVKTARLELVLMSVPFMEALARRDVEAAARDIGATVPMWMADELEGFLKYRLAQLAVDPDIRLWLGRAMLLTDEDGKRHVVGSIGFHGPPDKQGRLEVGYSVDPPYRRRGFARESVRALFDWAHATHGIETFVASISPDNEASLRLAAGFGFHQIGQQMDPIDGLELVFETRWPPAAAYSQGSGSLTGTSTLSSSPMVNSAPARRTWKKAKPTNHSGQPRVG
jgi:RimJ/RimL family protein N-acetyltransferase